MKKAVIIISFLIGIFLSGCFGLKIAIRSFGDTFSTPEKVENKEKNPIKDNIKLSALWIGHASALVQIYDKVIIMDPFFTTRLGGLMMRKKESGLDIEDVPKLDLVLVSHSHLDHMSFGSLEMIEDRFPGCTVVFPEGDEDYLPNFDLNLFKIKTGKLYNGKYVGNPVLINDMKITPVFAYHTGGRYAFDTYIWKTKGATGYIIQYKDVCIYFAGDTGYNEFAFKKIGEKFKIDLAFIPIGPCHNCDSTGMKYHASSMEALKILEDLKADYMIPIHFGALQYFSDPNYPKESLEKMLQDPQSEYYILRDKVKILKEGEQIIFQRTESNK